MQCGVMVQTQRVITSATRIAPWSEGQNTSDYLETDLFNYDAVCSIVGIARQTLYNTLSQHPEWFDAKRVRTGYRGREERLLTLRDVQRLAERYPVRVKR